MLIAADAFLIVAALVSLSSAAVSVVKTNRGPTGYEVTFTYHNPTASSVLLGGDVYSFTDQYHTTAQFNAGINLQDWRPGDFLAPISGYGHGGEQAGIALTNAGDGNWTYTTPFPSGTFAYNFIPDCDYAPNCTSTHSVHDPDNAPIQNFPGQQNNSIFQVPYDPAFQYYPDFNLNYDYTLPLGDPSKEGTLHWVNYTSDFPNTQDYAVYLPAGYTGKPEEPYPILYLCHGGGGNSADWPNEARVQYLLDRVIASGELEPTVVVMPSWNAALDTYSFTVTSAAVRENFMQYVFPQIEATYPVSTNASGRAFAGLSLGGALTYEMYINATSYFGYFGEFSGALLPGTPQYEYVNASMLAANPALATRGFYLGFGAYDIAFHDCRNLQLALDALDIPYTTRLNPTGAHYWNTWQDALWHFTRLVLWKGMPTSLYTGHGRI